MMRAKSPTSSQAKPGTWHATYRIFLGFVILYVTVWIVRAVMGVGPNLLMRWVGASPDFRAYIASTLNYGMGIIAYVLFPAIALRKVLDIKPWDVLFPFSRDWWKDLIFGFLLTTMVLALFFIVEMKMGWLIVDGWNWQTMPLYEWLRVPWVGLLINVGVAIGEETIFRGYLLTGLNGVWGKWTSLTIMMVIFGLFHLPAYSESGGMQSWTLKMAILLATLFGGLFGLIYLRTKSLWLPVSLHFAWNFIENDVLNLTAVSNNVNLIGAQTRLQSPLTATGLSLGNVVVMETMMFMVIALGVWFWLRHRQVADADPSA
jgi:membrane protease YdiL (CAAX protease family)